MMRLYRIKCVLSVIALLFASCVSQQSSFELSSPMNEDRDYYRSYQEATRGGDLIRDFGLSYRIHATYLYPEFRTRLAQRIQSIYLQETGSFSEADQKAGFLVTVYGSERDSEDLANTNHWSVVMQSKDGPIRPVLVRKITDKQRWSNFFETISPWSTEYLVVFDVAAVNPGTAKLVETPHVSIVIANNEGKVKMDW